MKEAKNVSCAHPLISSALIVIKHVLDVLFLFFFFYFFIFFRPSDTPRLSLNCPFECMVYKFLCCSCQARTTFTRSYWDEPSLDLLHTQTEQTDKKNISSICSWNKFPCTPDRFLSSCTNFHIKTDRLFPFFFGSPSTDMWNKIFVGLSPSVLYFLLVFNFLVESLLMRFSETEHKTSKYFKSLNWTEVQELHRSIRTDKNMGLALKCTSQDVRNDE